MDERSRERLLASCRLRSDRHCRQITPSIVTALVILLLVPVQSHAECEIQRFRSQWSSNVWGCSFDEVAAQFWPSLNHELTFTSGWWDNVSGIRDTRHHDFCAISSTGGCIQSRVFEYRCPSPYIASEQSIEQGRLLGCMEGECPVGHDRDEHGICQPEGAEPEPEGPVPVQPQADPRKQSPCHRAGQAASTTAAIAVQARSELTEALQDRFVPSVRDCESSAVFNSSDNEAKELPCFETRENIRPAPPFM